MKTVYEALREVMRLKELEIKRIEKEIEALRVVLPIVADMKQPMEQVLATVGVTGVDAGKAVSPLSPSELSAVFAQAATNPSAPITMPAAGGEKPKPRTSWP